MCSLSGYLFTRERVRFLPGFCQKQKLKGLKGGVAVTSSVTNPQKDLSPEVSICHTDFLCLSQTIC